MKWKTWFKVYNDTKWYTNQMEWENETEAVERAKSKFNGWTQAQSWLVMPIGKDPNNGYGGKDQ
tara:strand:- start:961 stop:1152 length:192 start_codon:yes stop_codon:yes gene_type:complete